MKIYTVFSFIQDTTSYQCSFCCSIESCNVKRASKHNFEEFSKILRFFVVNLSAMLLQTTTIFSSLIHPHNHCYCYSKNPTKKSAIFLQKSYFLPSLESVDWRFIKTRKSSLNNVTSTKATLLETPVLWAGRICIFYALLKAGLAGSPSNPIVSDLESGAEGFGFSRWIEELQSGPEKDATERRKLVSKWHPTTKGTLRRNYRVPSKSEGRRLLKSIASLLSDDDHFRDATSHKGCQIRRENAHGESVCCNNVRALFDELPTPHLIVEISPFPAGPLSDNDYAKAEKLERVLRSGPSV